MVSALPPIPPPNPHKGSGKRSLYGFAFPGLKGREKPKFYVRVGGTGVPPVLKIRKAL
jgi:hypothetical protein